jgi:rhodanese-related sulfurtransferase
VLVSPEDARRLLQLGYTYVDVRSEPEFALGRPPGALNVPVSRAKGDRLVDNPEFIDVMRALFRTTDPLVIGCASGARSHLVVERLAALAFSELVELRHGFSGSRDEFGRRLGGWAAHGLPIETGDAEARAYERLRLRSMLPSIAGG